MSTGQHTNAASINPDPLEVILAGALAALLDLVKAFLANRTIRREIEYVMIENFVTSPGMAKDSILGCFTIVEFFEGKRFDVEKTHCMCRVQSPCRVGILIGGRRHKPVPVVTKRKVRIAQRHFHWNKSLQWETGLGGRLSRLCVKLVIEVIFLAKLFAINPMHNRTVVFLILDSLYSIIDILWLYGRGCKSPFPCGLFTEPEL